MASEKQGMFHELSFPVSIGLLTRRWLDLLELTTRRNCCLFWTLLTFPLVVLCNEFGAIGTTWVGLMLNRPASGYGSCLRFPPVRRALGFSGGLRQYDYLLATNTLCVDAERYGASRFQSRNIKKRRFQITCEYIAASINYDVIEPAQHVDMSAVEETKVTCCEPTAHKSLFRERCVAVVAVEHAVRLQNYFANSPLVARLPDFGPNHQRATIERRAARN